MATIAAVLAVIAVIGAFASWIVGAVYYARTFAALHGNADMRWIIVVAWPFAVGRLQGAAAEHAAKVNKALVAFMVCVMVAAAAFAVATNLQRFAK